LPGFGGRSVVDAFLELHPKEVMPFFGFYSDVLLDKFEYLARLLFFLQSSLCKYAYTALIMPFAFKKTRFVRLSYEKANVRHSACATART
jgi:hypothetical protein